MSTRGQSPSTDISAEGRRISMSHKQVGCLFCHLTQLLKMENFLC